MACVYTSEAVWIRESIEPSRRGVSGHLPADSVNARPVESVELQLRRGDRRESRVDRDHAPHAKPRCSRGMCRVVGPAPNGTQVAHNACGVWVVANADGTGEAQPIDELMHRSWYRGGLTV